MFSNKTLIILLYDRKSLIYTLTHIVIYMTGDGSHFVSIIWYQNLNIMKEKSYVYSNDVKYYMIGPSVTHDINSILCADIADHCSDVIMSVMASQITSLTIVYSTIYSGSDQREHQSVTASLAFVRGIHPWPVNSLHKGPVMWQMFPFDDVIMILTLSGVWFILLN